MKRMGFEAKILVAQAHVASSGATLLGMIVSVAMATVDSHIVLNATTAGCMPLVINRRSSIDGAADAGKEGTGKPASAADAMAELELREAAAACVNSTIDILCPA